MGSFSMLELSLSEYLVSIPRKKLKTLGRSDFCLTLASSYNRRVNSPASLILWKHLSGRLEDISVEPQGGKKSPCI